MVFIFPQTHANWVSESAELAEVGDLDGAAEAEVRLQALEEAWLLYNTEPMGTYLPDLRWTMLW